MKKYLGIELGSTRIKSVLIGEDFQALAVGSHTWENQLADGIWTYSMDAVFQGLADSYKDMAKQYQAAHGEVLTGINGIGISAMMHGYLPLDKDGVPVAAFRTWRNTNTADAAHALSEQFQFNIPLRWSIAHVYQAILNEEAHVQDIDHLTTLAGYVHYKLTGEKVLGIGDASGMFPIDSKTKQYDMNMAVCFDTLVKDSALNKNIIDLLPSIKVAGEEAGLLTDAGALLLDPSGALKAGVPLCPPEGDAGTGMVATHSVAAHTGNLSCGTSIFAMLVLEQSLSARYPQIDMVTTPAGLPVAMVHCNNGSSDLDAWVKLMHETVQLFNPQTSLTDIYNNLYHAALSGDADAGGLTAVNYLSGEHNTGFEAGRPLFVQSPYSNLTLGNFMRAHLYAAVATLRLGMDVLMVKEGVQIDKIYGHGGFFTVKGVAQQLFAGALNVPIAVMDTAGEGGAWGIALLAAFMCQDAANLDAFLDEAVFKDDAGSLIMPKAEDVKGYHAFIERYQKALLVERAAVDNL